MQKLPQFHDATLSHMIAGGDAEMCRAALMNAYDAFGFVQDEMNPATFVSPVAAQSTRLALDNLFAGSAKYAVNARNPISSAGPFGVIVKISLNAVM